MGGLSFGTEATLWTVMKSDLLAAASITSVGMSRNYYLFASRHLDGVQVGGGGKDPPARGGFIQRAELPVILQRLEEGIASQILMQMPEQEYVIALDYAVPLIRDQRADLYVFPNEPHQKFQPRHKLAAYERNVDWFRFWLQGYEDPDPAKRGEYKRWRAMKAAGDKRSS